MKNRYLEKFDSIVKVRITGKNIHNYIRRMMKEKIQIIKLIPISYQEVHLIMKYSEYERLTHIKSVLYQVTILSYVGRLKIKKTIHKNIIFFMFLGLGIVFLIFLSRVIFSVEVIHQDKEIRQLVMEELKHYGVTKYQFKKSYYELENIEDKILENNKDRLEWIEITEVGTKYTVRVEERKIHEEKEVGEYQNIVSKKEAVLVSVKAIRGEKVKTVNDYVKKGDVVIAGYITLPNNTRAPTVALGEVLGEVWYTVKMDYPFIYQESNLTGNSKTVFAIHFFDKRVGLFDFDKYRTFSSKDKTIFSSLLLNIRFVKEKQYETVIKDEVYTEDIAQNKAVDYIKSKIMKDNPDIKEVSEVKILTSSSDEDSIKLNLFIRVIENIGQIAKIDENSYLEAEESS